MLLKIIKQLGEGGFGVVDLVEDEVGNRYARKTFRYGGPKNAFVEANALTRFRKEAKVQKGLSHRNIVPIVGGDLNADPPFYLMPVAESSLEADMADDPRLGGEWLAAISDIVAGLEELHSLEIYHRDLKPQNVLRFADSAGAFYAIGDFGLISRKDTQLSSLTVTGMKKGSDNFTAPEITGDLRKASVQSDIYSLGCVLHEIVGIEDRVPCGEIREGGPYAAILLNCTRQEPARRFKSARSVLDSVLAVDDDTPPATSPTAIAFVETLQAFGARDHAFWQRLLDYVEESPQETERVAVLRAITLEHIAEVGPLDKKLASSLATVYAEWIKDSSFNFEACDGLGNRLVAFLPHCSLEAQVDCLVALLELGTSHNRWYVERLFAQQCDTSMDVTLARRMAVEFRVLDDEICRLLLRLESSIDFSRTQLHPILHATLKDICE